MVSSKDHKNIRVRKNRREEKSRSEGKRRRGTISHLERGVNGDRRFMPNIPARPEECWPPGLRDSSCSEEVEEDSARLPVGLYRLDTYNRGGGGGRGRENKGVRMRVS